MFRYLEQRIRPRPSVAITIDGIVTQVREGETLAAAMLQSGRLDLRTSAVTGSPRGAYCMMGICFECLVTIGDQPNQQACMTLVRPGMHVERQLVRSLGRKS